MYVHLDDYQVCDIRDMVHRAETKVVAGSAAYSAVSELRRRVGEDRVPLLEKSETIAFQDGSSPEPWQAETAERIKRE